VVALALYVTQLYGPLAQLSNARVDLMTALVSFERVFEVLDLPHAIREGRSDCPGLVDDHVGHVRFDRVSFRYPPSSATSLASLEGPRAEHGHRRLGLDPAPTSTSTSRRARWWPSSVRRVRAKSTLSSLVPRLYDVTEGRVLIDGYDVRDLTLDSLRDRDRCRQPGRPPVPRLDRREPALRTSRRDRRRARRGGDVPPASTSSSIACPTATTRRR
jgi:ATP-binding cassette, subfamily B, bacterial